MKKAYVVMKKGYEYDDEIYYESEDGGGHPSKIFFTKESSDAEVDRLNIEKVRRNELYHYYHDIKDICDDTEGLKELCESLNNKYGQDKIQGYFDEYRLHSSATFEEAKAYYNMINLSFYESVEVEIDQQDMRDSQISSVLEN